MRRIVARCCSACFGKFSNFAPLRQRSLHGKLLVSSHGRTRGRSRSRKRQAKHVRHVVSRVRHHHGRLGIRRLSFGSFCRFSIRHVPSVYTRGRVSNVSVSACHCVVGSFCQNNGRRGALGRGVSDSLFSRAFVIFRVSDVGSSPLLFPLIALVVVSMFLRGVHVGGGHGILIVRRT